MKRLLVITALCCALVMSAAGYASAKSLHIITPWEIKALDTISDRIFGRLGIVEMLVAVGPGGELVGRLAESWSVSDDQADLDLQNPPRHQVSRRPPL